MEDSLAVEVERTRGIAVIRVSDGEEGIERGRTQSLKSWRRENQSCQLEEACEGDRGRVRDGRRRDRQRWDPLE